MYVRKWCATQSNQVDQPSSPLAKVEKPIADDPVEQHITADDFYTPPSSPMVSPDPEPLDSSQLDYIRETLESMSMTTIKSQAEMSEEDIQWGLALDAQLYEIEEPSEESLLLGEVADASPAEEEDLLLD